MKGFTLNLDTKRFTLTEIKKLQEGLKLHKELKRERDDEWDDNGYILTAAELPDWETWYPFNSQHPFIMGNLGIETGVGLCSRLLHLINYLEDSAIDRAHGGPQKEKDITENCDWPDIIYYYARDVDGADVKALQDKIIDATNKFYQRWGQVLEAAKSHLTDKEFRKLKKYPVPGTITDQPYHGYFSRSYDFNKRILERIDGISYKEMPYAIAYFARDVKGADIKLLQDAVIKLGDPYAMLKFAEIVEGADLKLLQKEAKKCERREKIQTIVEPVSKATANAVNNVKTSATEKMKATANAVNKVKTSATEKVKETVERTAEYIKRKKDIREERKAHAKYIRELNRPASQKIKKIKKNRKKEKNEELVAKL